MKKPLSNRQREVLNAVAELWNELGRTPTIREICTKTELTSTSSIHAHLRALEARGEIVYLDNHHRHFKLSEDKQEAQQ